MIIFFKLLLQTCFNFMFLKMFRLRPFQKEANVQSWKKMYTPPTNSATNYNSRMLLVLND